MTNSGQGGQATTKLHQQTTDYSANRTSGASHFSFSDNINSFINHHNAVASAGSDNTNSAVDLQYFYLNASNSLAAHQSSRLCIHRILFSKCKYCNVNSANTANTSSEDNNSQILTNLELSNKFTMNSINPEALLSHDPKHLFGSSMGSIGGNPLTGHLGHIGTSIAAGISGGVNHSLTMAGSHLHHSHHHPSSHPSTLHSMTAPGFTIHSHLSVATGQRRMSNSGNTSGNRLHKSQGGNSNSSSNNNKQFLCPMCNKLFTQKGNLKTHMMIHTGDKPYACHVCGKSFTQKGNVDTHIKIHTGVKDYSCERCGKSFTQRGNLRTHVRSVHTKEKPYICSVCGKIFSQKGNMRTHIRTHNKDDRFPCSLCGKTFSQKGNLKTHLQRHAGTLPKRYGPGGQRRQTTSRLLQVPGMSGAGTAAVAAAAVYAIAAAGNTLDRNHPNQPQSSQPNSQLNRNTPVSVETPADTSRSPTLLVHPSGGSMVAANASVRAQQQSVISNVQNQQPIRNQQVESPPLYPVSSHNNSFNSITMNNANMSHHHHHNPPNSFNLSSATPSAAAAAAAVLLSSTSNFKDHKTNHLHFMSSLFH